MFLNKIERLKIVLDIMKSLKDFKGRNNEPVNLYSDQYSFITEFKKITKEYIDLDDNNPKNMKEFKGTLYFEEIDRNIEYILPIKSYRKPLFVIRQNR
jgi:hypothetical protein